MDLANEVSTLATTAFTVHLPALANLKVSEHHCASVCHKTNKHVHADLCRTDEKDLTAFQTFIYSQNEELDQHDGPGDDQH